MKNFLENPPSDEEALGLTKVTDIKKMMDLASNIRDECHRNVISYSRKIFFPLTKLCRDFC